MLDLGFGLADRRSVMAVLFVFFLCSAHFGYALPVDTSDPVLLFVSLVILTGYLFAARTAFRVLLVLIQALLRFAYDFCTFAANEKSADYQYGWDDETGQPRRSRLRSYLRSLRRGAGRSLKLGIVVPLFIERDWMAGLDSRYYYGHAESTLGVLGALDRTALVAFAYAAVAPRFHALRDNIGLAGIALLILAYMLTGRFTIALTDAYHKAELDHDKLVAAAGHPDFPRVITTRPECQDYGP